MLDNCKSNKSLSWAFTLRDLNNNNRAIRFQSYPEPGVELNSENSGEVWRAGREQHLGVHLKWMETPASPAQTQKDKQKPSKR